MSRNDPPRLKPHTEKEPFFLRWPVIVIIFLLFWPVGLILLIVKLVSIIRKNRKESTKKDDAIPFTKHKTREERADYTAKQTHRRKRLITVAVMTLLFLVLGCLGLTRDYLDLFFGDGFSSDLVLDMVCHALFLLVGIYIASRGYRFFEQQLHYRDILKAVGGNAAFPMERLEKETGRTRAQLEPELQEMLEANYFGTGAAYDASAAVLHCYQKEE